MGAVILGKRRVIGSRKGEVDVNLICTKVHQSSLCRRLLTFHNKTGQQATNEWIGPLYFWWAVYLLSLRLGCWCCCYRQKRLAWCFCLCMLHFTRCNCTFVLLVRCVTSFAGARNRYLHQLGLFFHRRRPGRPVVMSCCFCVRLHENNDPFPAGMVTGAEY